MVEKIEEVTDEQWMLVNEESRKMVEEFLRESTQLSPYTLGQYASCLRIYFNWIRENANNKPFYEIRSRDFLMYQNWLVRRGLSSSAVKLKRSVVSSFNGYIELYLEEEYKNYRNYVTKKIPSPPPAFVNKKQPLSSSEYIKLCEKLEADEMWQQLAYLKFSYATAARRNEVRQLLKEVINYDPIIKDVETKDKDGNPVVVQSISFLSNDTRCKGKGRTGNVRKLQFDQSAMDAIKKWLDIRGEDDCPYVFITKHGKRVEPIKVETFNAWCNDIFEKIVGRRVHPHLFRESRATILTVEQGRDISVAQKLLSHKSSQTTEIYVIRPDKDASSEAFID